MQMTLQTLKVVHAFLSADGGDRYGYELCQLTDLKSGTVYPILARLEEAGWVTSGWVVPLDVDGDEFPRRRYYRLTDLGEVEARRAFDAAMAGLPS